MKTAIRDVSQSLRRFVELALQDDPELSPYFDPADPNPDAIGTMIVTLDNPQELEEKENEGVSIWLYLLQREECTLNRPLRRVAADKLERRPLPLRLHYLITPLVDHSTRNDATELEQLILGKILQTFHDESSLSGARLLASLAGSGLELFMRLETLSLEEITRVWDALDKPYQLCVSFELSIVPITSGQDAEQVKPVDALVSETGAARFKEAV
ncbi:DUF4255 domain-containing protein [Chitinimonas lacunae]|uniref:DUF4255 domain-containing protein n=1 Tax=Chitinimonas lacunae TaxID=1963018 RepID=A0ABV8MKG9_9NEIS